MTTMNARRHSSVLIILLGLLGLALTANTAAGESALALRADEGKDARKFVYEIRDRRVKNLVGRRLQVRRGPARLRFAFGCLGWSRDSSTPAPDPEEIPLHRPILPCYTRSR